MHETDLQLIFILSHREKSKDVNSSTVTIEILENKITISKTFGGFKAPDNEFNEKKMTAEMQQQIMDFIRKNNLDKNLKEIKNTDKLGISGRFSFELINPSQSKIKIEGKTNMWGTDEYVRKNWGKKYVESRTNIKNINYFNVASNFIFMIEDL